MSTQLYQALGTGGVGWKALPPSAGHLHTTLVVLGARAQNAAPIVDVRCDAVPV
ncbi:MAG: hypothetical protein IPK82_23840 [Polyangiaceae bacterium]|nr:hypothetical protein [Polyangiaceae bacterium]